MLKSFFFCESFGRRWELASTCGFSDASFASWSALAACTWRLEAFWVFCDPESVLEGISKVAAWQLNMQVNTRFPSSSSANFWGQMRVSCVSCDEFQMQMDHRQGHPLPAPPEYLQTHLRAGAVAQATSDVPTMTSDFNEMLWIRIRILRDPLRDPSPDEVCGGHREMPVDAFKALLMERSRAHSNCCSAVIAAGKAVRGPSNRCVLSWKGGMGSRQKWVDSCNETFRYF